MNKNKKNGIKTVGVSLVVAQNGNKFCCTDEFKGWYLPAGRVDFGETFTTAAKREAMEEAGLEVELTGILRFEYSFSSDLFRLRVVFSGEAKDPAKELKSVADDETYGAAWLTLDELHALAEQDAQVLSKIKSLPYSKRQKGRTNDKLRSKEVLRIFSWVEKGTSKFPLAYFSGRDGTVVDSNKVKTSICYFVQIIVHNPETKCIILEGKSDHVNSLPRIEMKTPEHFQVLAEKLLFDLVETGRVKLEGICSVYHEAPRSFKKNVDDFFGTFVVTYYARAKEDILLDIEKKHMAWVSIESLASKYTLQHESEQLAMENFLNDITAPLSILAQEGSEYVHI